MNAMELILSEASIISEKAWEKEKSFFMKAIKLTDAREKTFIRGCIPSRETEPEKYEEYKIASENYYEFLIGVKTVNPTDVNNYAFKSKSAYFKFKELQSTIFRIKSNPDKYLAILERDYKEQVTAKLQQALIKKEINLLDESTVEKLNIGESPRGYTISAIINGKSFVTECIGAGGYNIQSFHYRYIIKYN